MDVIFVELEKIMLLYKRMKHLLAVIILFTVNCLCIRAQQEDTIKTETPFKNILQPNDTLFQDKKDLKINSFHPEYNHFEKQDSEFCEDHVTSGFDKTKRETNIFNAPYSKFIIPTTLIFYGVVTRGNTTLRRLDHNAHYEVTKRLKVLIPIDDYTQFAPAVAVYGFDIAGKKAGHNFRDRTIVMAASYIIVGGVVHTMKNTINVWRPNGSNNKSFPSGHTATAFVGAHILFREYRDSAPWIGVVGYTVAASTGILRVLNKKHWVSDVVTGAGIGVLSAEAGYILLPVFHKVLRIKDMNKNLVITPAIELNNFGLNNYGIRMAYTL